MRYMGGKQLISTRISEVINHEISRIRGGDIRQLILWSMFN